MTTVRVLAPAKVNLGLSVGPARSDGRHPIEGLVTFVVAADVITISPADALSFEITGPFAENLRKENPEDNLVMRAARSFIEASGIDLRAAIHLEKNLPPASGIGGGSSNAAATLKAMAEFYARPDIDLVALARPLGGDVPVCLDARPAVLTGTGEDFHPATHDPFDLVLVNPCIPVPTGAVYRAFDHEMRDPCLVPEPRRHFTQADIRTLTNDLTAPAMILVPELETVARDLTRRASVPARMSGSGGTFFGIFRSAEEARQVAKDLKGTHPDWWIVATRTLASPSPPV
jgi:4-diphosphocytidyl-2-C-methyl-D-erythritol kinase